LELWKWERLYFGISQKVDFEIKNTQVCYASALTIFLFWFPFLTGITFASCDRVKDGSGNPFLDEAKLLIQKKLKRTAWRRPDRTDLSRA